MRQAIVLGHSHVNALAQAIADQGDRWLGVSVHRLEDKRAKENSLSIPAAISLIEKQSSNTPVFLAILGAYHNLLGLLRSGEAFDVLLGPDDAPDPQAKDIVPHRAMQSALGEQFGLSDKLRNLITAGGCPVFLISTPPPKQSNDYILRQFMSQKKRIYRGRPVEQFGIERPGTRLKLWLLEARLMAEWAKSLGAGFLAAPAEAFDPDGFLREDYYSDDVTHANKAYGALVLDQVAAILNGSSKQVSHG